MIAQLKERHAGLRVEADVRNEKLGYKIRAAQMQKLPYMLVVGEREAEDGTVAVRSRAEGEQGVVPVMNAQHLFQGKLAHDPLLNLLTRTVITKKNKLVSE